MLRLKYKIEKGFSNNHLIFLTVSSGYNHYIGDSTDNNISGNVTTMVQTFKGCTDSRSAGGGITYPSTYINKTEKNYRRLLIEQRELKRKQSNIENRLIEIQNDINSRREEVRRGGLWDQG